MMQQQIFSIGKGRFCRYKGLAANQHEFSKDASSTDRAPGRAANAAVARRDSVTDCEYRVVGWQRFCEPARAALDAATGSPVTPTHRAKRNWLHARGAVRSEAVGRRPPPAHPR